MKNTKKGFTLFEILVVMGIFSIAMVLATQSLVLILRSTKKSESLVKSKENLNYALAVIERQIHNANSITCPSSTTIEYTDRSDTKAYFTCQAGYIASSSSFPVDSSTRLTSDEVSVSNCSFTCNLTEIPPSVDISVTGDAVNSQGVESGKITISSKLYLRTY